MLLDRGLLVLPVKLACTGDFLSRELSKAGTLDRLLLLMNSDVVSYRQSKADG